MATSLCANGGYVWRERRIDDVERRPRNTRARSRVIVGPTVSTPIDPVIVREWLVAAERGDLATMERQLAAEPRLVDALGAGPYWDGDARALHFAASRGHREVIRWLLARGASAAPVQGDGDWAPLHFAAAPAKADVVDVLLEHGARMDVFAAAALGDARTVRELLRIDPALATSRGPDGATPLHFAASPEVATILLEAGADPGVRDAFHDQTPVEWTSERPDVVAVLAAAGAEIGIHVACAVGDLPRVAEIVDEDPRAVDATVEGETPLGIAARHGRSAVVDLLLARGASASAGLPGAVFGGDRGIVARLLEAGADPNALGPGGHAGLHAAAATGDLAIIRLLLTAGARLDLEDAEHRATPLRWAEYHGHEAAAALLA